MGEGFIVDEAGALEGVQDIVDKLGHRRLFPFFDAAWIQQPLAQFVARTGPLVEQAQGAFAHLRGGLFVLVVDETRPLAGCVHVERFLQLAQLLRVRFAPRWA